MTDTDALQRYARRRDPAAFAHLIESYQQMVYAVCLRRLGHEADARDATQDTFVKLARSAGDIRAADGSVVGWLHRCATTTSIDLMRSESRRRGRERAAALAERVDSSDLPWHDVRSSLDEALGELPDAQRDLIVQRYLVGRTQAHLAAEADVSPSMMSRRVHAALDALRERLRGKGFGIGLAALTSGLGAEAAVALPAHLSAALATTITTAAATTATAPASASLPASSSAALPSAGGGFTSASGGGSGGWLWLGTKIKLSTAILGSLGIHAALVGVVLWLGPGLSTLVTPPTPSAAPQSAGSGPSQPVSPPRSADAPRVIRVADAEAVEPLELPAATDTATQEAPAEFVYLMGSIARPGAYTVPADADLTLKQLIASAGGTDAIDERLVRLIRRAEGEAQEQTVVEAPLREVIETAIGDTPVQPDDLVVLGEAAADDAAPPPLVDPALEGVWVGVEVNDPDVTRTLTIEGNTLDLRAVDGPEWYVVEVVASIPEADPPRFNCVIRDAPADFLKGQSAPVIMKREQIDGREVLTYASLGPGATDYPEDFEPGNGSRVFRFEKQPAPDAEAAGLEQTEPDHSDPLVLPPDLAGDWFLLWEYRQGQLVEFTETLWPEEAAEDRADHRANPSTWPTLNPQETVTAFLAEVAAPEGVSEHVFAGPEAQEQAMEFFGMRGNRDLRTLRVPNAMIHQSRRAVVVSDLVTRGDRSGVYVFLLERSDEADAGRPRWLIGAIGFESSFEVDQMKKTLGTP